MVKWKLDRKSSKPLYAQLRNTLKKMIQTGKWKPGDKLPPIKALARELNVTHVYHPESI